VRFAINGSTGILAGLVIAISTAAVLLYRVDIVEDAQAVEEKRLDYIEENQRKLDRNQRETAADVEWANDKLDKLLDTVGVNDRIKRPPIKPSTMREPE
jgi:hypothetical protein